MRGVSARAGRLDAHAVALRVLRPLLALALTLSLAHPVYAQERELALPAPMQQRTPDWTWAVLGTGIGFVAVGLGTGIGALVVQSDLDRVCGLTCPRSVGDYQMEGRVLAVTTDVLWLGGIVLGALGLVAALTLREDVPPLSVAFACDGTGCLGTAGGTF